MNTSDLSQEAQQEFLEATEKVIKWLNDHCHPHVTVVIDSTRAEACEGFICHRTEKFLRD
jgi:hypothetical protein